VVVHLENYTDVPAATLADAERNATIILAAAGVQIIWVGAEADAASRDDTVLHLRVLLLSSEMRAEDQGKRPARRCDGPGERPVTPVRAS
jgi:hypothetical protein